MFFVKPRSMQGALPRCLDCRWLNRCSFVQIICMSCLDRVKSESIGILLKLFSHNYENMSNNTLQRLTKANLTYRFFLLQTRHRDR